MGQNKQIPYSFQSSVGRHIIGFEIIARIQSTENKCKRLINVETNAERSFSLLGHLNMSDVIENKCRKMG